MVSNNENNAKINSGFGVNHNLFIVKAAFKTYIKGILFNITNVIVKVVSSFTSAIKSKENKFASRNGTIVRLEDQISTLRNLLKTYKSKSRKSAEKVEQDESSQSKKTETEKEEEEVEKDLEEEEGFDFSDLELEFDDDLLGTGVKKNENELEDINTKEDLSVDDILKDDVDLALTSGPIIDDDSKDADKESVNSPEIDVNDDKELDEISKRISDMTTDDTKIEEDQGIYSNAWRSAVKSGREGKEDSINKFWKIVTNEYDGEDKDELSNFTNKDTIDTDEVD